MRSKAVSQNPIQKALADADVIQGANRALEHQSGGGVRILDRAGLFADAVEQTSDSSPYATDVVALYDRATSRGDGVAVYENHDLGHPELGQRQYVSFGGPEAQLETAGDTWTQGPHLGLAQFGLTGYLPKTLPDIGGRINWRYQLVAIVLPGREH